MNARPFKIGQAVRVPDGRVGTVLCYGLAKLEGDVFVQFGITAENYKPGQLTLADGFAEKPEPPEIAVSA